MSKVNPEIQKIEIIDAEKGHVSQTPMANPPKPNQVAPDPNPKKKKGFVNKMWNGVKSGAKKAAEVTFFD